MESCYLILLMNFNFSDRLRFRKLVKGQRSVGGSRVFADGDVLSAVAKRV